MRKNIISIFLVLIPLFTMCKSETVVNTTTITTNQQGTNSGYFYSFWNQGGGLVKMTLGDGGNYSVVWSNCSNFTWAKAGRLVQIELLVSQAVLTAEATDIWLFTDGQKMN